MKVLSITAILCFSSFAFSANSAKVLLVSDIDDTIKISHILEFAGKIVRSGDVVAPFKGMAQLYQLVLNQNPQNTKIVYLSNAPDTIAGIPALRISHQTFLNTNHFPTGDLDLVKQTTFPFFMTCADFKWNTKWNNSQVAPLVQKINNRCK